MSRLGANDSQGFATGLGVAALAFAPVAVVIGVRHMRRRTARLALPGNEHLERAKLNAKDAVNSSEAAQIEIKNCKTSGARGSCKDAVANTVNAAKNVSQAEAHLDSVGNIERSHPVFAQVQKAKDRVEDSRKQIERMVTR